MQNLDSTLLLSSGIPGLDDILGGGLTADRVYVIEGEPGTGKTTTGMQFLVEGARLGESVVYITLADSPLRYRRQVLALKHFFAERSCTVMLLHGRTSTGADLQIRSIAHGVISLEQAVRGYGAERRRIRVIKFRGRAFRRRALRRLRAPTAIAARPATTRTISMPTRF